MYHDGQGVPQDATHSFETTMTALAEIYKDTHGFQTLIFDTVDGLEPLVIAATCQMHGWKSIEQPPYGRGYVEASSLWRRLIAAITAIRNRHGMTIVMCCHSVVERIDDPRVPSYTSYQPRLHRRARALLMDTADMVLFYGDDLRVVTESNGFGERTRGASDAKRYLFTERRPAFAAKNRYGLPTKIPVDLNFDISELSKYWRPPA
jgi:AAA domain